MQDITSRTQYENYNTWGGLRSLLSKSSGGFIPRERFKAVVAQISTSPSECRVFCNMQELRGVWLPRCGGLGSAARPIRLDFASTV